MKSICFYFQVHQPFRLANFRFFDIGSQKSYFDEQKNMTIMLKVAEKCYLPTNQIMLDLIKKHQGRFKISYSISGTAIDQFELYAPDVLQSFKRLADTGCVEFLSETYSHSLAVLRSEEEFKKQVEDHKKKIQFHFNQDPKVFRNTELIYSDYIGKVVADMGYIAMLTEGADKILEWKSPNFLYANIYKPNLKILLKNYKLSDDIAFRFSQESWQEWPLTAEKYAHWLNAIPGDQFVVNLFMDYETFGEHQWESTGIFEFLKALPDQVFKSSNFKFLTPSEVVENYNAVDKIDVPHPISWADIERDLTAWLGNDLQEDAFNSLYELESLVRNSEDDKIKRDWNYLQTSDHFYYLCTKWFEDGDVHKYFNPFNSPYEAFINYMNVLSDFKLRLDKYCQEEVILSEVTKG